MKISTLIEELKRIEAEWGDKEVYVLTSEDNEESIEDIEIWMVGDGEGVECFLSTCLRSS
jgi:hypothetical protein